MLNRSNRTVVTSPVSQKSFKFSSFEKKDCRESIKVSQKVIEDSEEFERIKGEYLRIIEENKKKLELEVNKNKQLRLELESFSAGCWGSKKGLKGEQQGDSLVEYYQVKLEEIEKLAEEQKKEYDEFIRRQETENERLKTVIRENGNK